MKKVLTFLFIYIFSIGYSQSGIGNDNSFQSKNIFPGPSTAEAYSFSKIGKLPMDLFRGKANISIPFYSIKVDGLELPISISYNTGGIKLNEVASSVGLGWTLNIPGTINKSIIGKDDNVTPFFNKDINTYGSYNGYVSHLISDAQRRVNLQGIYEGNYDLKPDLYSYSLPGLSGSFIMDGNNMGLTIPFENVKIEQIPSPYITQRKFRVTDTSGNLFWLSPKNLSSSNDPTNPIAGDVITSALFRLDSIRTVSNKTVKFFYEKNFGYVEKNIVERIYTKTAVDYDPGRTYFSQLPPPYERWNTETGNTENLISKIEFPEGIVEFKYSNDENGTLAIENGVLVRKDLNINNGVALRKIVVKDKSNKIILDQRLNYNYFSSNNSNKTYEDYRLKLINIYDALSQSYYRFSYNEDFPMPARNSHNDDYWGYINNLGNTSLNSNLPIRIYTDVPIIESRMPSVTRRDRAPNPAFSQIGILKSIEYPTKGKKNLYYENPLTEQINTSSYLVSEGINKDISSHGVVNDISTYNGGETKTFILNASDIPSYAINPVFTYGFDSGCLSAENPGPGSGLPENPDNGNYTECFGDIKITSVNSPSDTRHFSSNGQPFSGDIMINIPFPIKVEMVLSRMGYCNCGLNAGLSWKKEITETSTTPNYLSGLRIKKIEDVDQNNVSNIFEYKYGKFDIVKNKFEEISLLKRPFNFTRIDKKPYRKFDSSGEELHPSNVQDFFTVSNSDQSSNSYGSSDIVTYPYVIEENGLGKIYYEFSDKDYKIQNILSSDIGNYNDWKYGLPLNQKYVNKNGQTVKTIEYEYQFNTIKNGLSGFNTNDPSKIAFAVDMLVMPSKIQLSPSQGGEGDIFIVENKVNFIESAKIENTKTTEKDFLSGQVIEKNSISTYYDTDINKPINVKTVSIKSPDNSVSETTYQYAHEKGNQKLINANMIGIPLETSVVEKPNVTVAGKTVSRSETKYDDPAHLFPTSILSYNVLNSESSTEVTYNKYDTKGNIQQYTTKDGIPTAIVWGYNNTQPIAKVEGVSYDQLVNLGIITAIVNASNADASNPANEPALITALDTFRKNSGLSAYQVSTYTYDPLIGVTSITAPSGIREVYIYDTANRLKEIRQDSKTGNLIKEFKYNYKN
ncbi:hypothetical protein CEY12_21600 [Chryseobacterium sp. T16E-39]|uniref:hypothetical protein n=1 Tax=Chryseobacterium sp. T16E-39 TaxID=2015076 RepID=UPI000B5B13FC|nr:hypothetical protein [Chryseobacterium sp. T16E-39]ASK32520.1 hypothetical protein CEY12_21600 [Chryseobacterium sp. T16E-39]